MQIHDADGRDPSNTEQNIDSKTYQVTWSTREMELFGLQIAEALERVLPNTIQNGVEIEKVRDAFFPITELPATVELKKFRDTMATITLEAAAIGRHRDSLILTIEVPAEKEKSPFDFSDDIFVPQRDESSLLVNTAVQVALMEKGVKDLENVRTELADGSMVYKLKTVVPTNSLANIKYKRQISAEPADNAELSLDVSLSDPVVAQEPVRLDPNKRSPEGEKLMAALKAEVVGQDEALEHIVDAVSRTLAGIQDPDRPLLTMLLPGPTGVGKTETVRGLAKALLGSRHAVTKIDGPEYSTKYNVSKLLGSPPGYVGGEIPPILAQDNLERHFAKAINEQSGLIGRGEGEFAQFHGDSAMPVSIILIDELDKAHPAFHDLLLGPLDDGELVLSNNQVTDFRGSILIATANTGTQDLTRLLAGSSTVGFNRESELQDFNLKGVVGEALKKSFRPEFLNRFDDIVTYNTLKEEHLHHIAEKLFGAMQERVLVGRIPFKVEIMPEAKEQLVALGHNPAYGARPMRGVVEKNITSALARLVNNRQISENDKICIGFEDGEFTYTSHGQMHGTEAERFRMQAEVARKARDLTPDKLDPPVRGGTGTTMSSSDLHS